MMNATNFRISFIQLNTIVAATQNTAILLGHICTTCSLSIIKFLNAEIIIEKSFT